MLQQRSGGFDEKEELEMLDDQESQLKEHFTIFLERIHQKFGENYIKNSNNLEAEKEKNEMKKASRPQSGIGDLLRSLVQIPNDGKISTEIINDEEEVNPDILRDEL